jgi:hypothetical protein
VFLAARGTVAPGPGPVITYDSTANPVCQGKQCLILRTRGCTDPVQANAEVVVRYRDAAGKPEYRVVKTDANGCFEDFQILTAGGNWTVTALIEGSPCLVPIEVTQVVHTPLPTGTDTAGPSLSTPTIVRPVYLKARGALTMRAKAAPCQN